MPWSTPSTSWMHSLRWKLQRSNPVQTHSPPSEPWYTVIATLPVPIGTPAPCTTYKESSTDSPPSMIKFGCVTNSAECAVV